ncbi:MAG: hypothetical protein LLG14_16585 [Nocardiaceae bacterium]|nr:hypothetical protein [Nocardiaceae bacterium]
MNEHAQEQFDEDDIQLIASIARAAVEDHDKHVWDHALDRDQPDELDSPRSIHIEAVRLAHAQIATKDVADPVEGLIRRVACLTLRHMLDNYNDWFVEHGFRGVEIAVEQASKAVQWIRDAGVTDERGAKLIREIWSRVSAGEDFPDLHEVGLISAADVT